MWITAFLKTLRTAFKAYFIRMLLLSLGITAIGYAVFFYGVTWILGATSFISIGWLEWILDWLAGIGTGIIAWFLFPAILPLIASMFMEVIAGQIEKQEYDMAKPPSLPFWPEVWNGLAFAGWSLLLNVLVLPFYLFAPLIPFIYYSLNAYLLGREFFEIVAGRHIGRREAKLMRQTSYRFHVFMAGLVIAVSVNIPIINLFAPFIGVAIMVHLYQRTLAKA